MFALCENNDRSSGSPHHHFLKGILNNMELNKWCYTELVNLVLLAENTKKDMYKTYQNTSQQIFIEQYHLEKKA
jgi:hypothetical protein